MSVRLHLIEAAAKQLAGDLTAVLLRHVTDARDSELTGREITSVILTGLGVGATGALGACIVFGVPGGRAGMYDEAVEKLTEALVANKAETVAAVERLSR